MADDCPRGGRAEPTRSTAAQAELRPRTTPSCTCGTSRVCAPGSKDISRAKDFYRDKLGMEPSESMEDDSVMYRCGNGTGFLIYQTENAGTAKNTQMGWETDNLEREMEELRGRGIAFDEYDFPGLKTENGVATSDWGKSAWFLDSEGNILNISQRT